MNNYSELEKAAEVCASLLPLRFMESHGSLYIRNDFGIVFDVHQNRSFPKLMIENRAYASYILDAAPAVVLALIAENKAMASAYAAAGEREHELRKELAALRSDLSEQCSISNDLAQEASDANELIVELRKKLTTVHFVCDRLPDQDGCRFIELENPQGESLGDESGKWEIRPDGLAQLVVDIASPDVKRMAALLECAQGDLKQAMQIIERDGKDAERYRFLRRTDSWGDIDFDDHGLWIVNARDEVINQDGAKLDAAVDAAMSKEKVISFSTPSQQLPRGCWEWVVPKGTEAPCRICSGFGTIQTGIDEAPSTVCNACEGTGKEKGHDQP